MRQVVLSLAAALVFSVASAYEAIKVEGAVNKPALVNFKEGMRVRDVIAEAGGLSPTADPKAVKIYCEGDVQTVDIAKLGPTPLVHPGSKVVVATFDPHNYVSIRGAVTFVGPVAYTEGLTIAQVVAQATPYQDARLDNIKVTRTQPNGKKETLRVNLGDSSDVQAMLMPGDYVEVPYPGKPFTASDRELLTIIVIGLLILLLAR